MVNISIIILLIKNNDNGSGFLEYNRLDPLNPELDQSIYTGHKKDDREKRCCCLLLWSFWRIELRR